MQIMQSLHLIMRGTHVVRIWVVIKSFVN